MRYEILFALKSIVNGVDSIPNSIQREISKAARTHLSDRVMAVRSASALVFRLITQILVTRRNK